jgi:hypothetical protein
VAASSVAVPDLPPRRSSLTNASTCARPLQSERLRLFAEGSGPRQGPLYTVFPTFLFIE